MVDENKVRELYVDYNTVIKPLIAEVEARMEQFPLPLFNEIRALHDHISRCYSDNITDKQTNEELEKGKRHVVRIILDCYKYLNLSLHDSMRVCHNVKLLSFCHPERSRRVSRKLMGDVSTSLRYAQHDSMIGLLHFDTPSC